MDVLVEGGGRRGQSGVPRPLEPVDFAGAIPGEHPWRWLTAEDLAEAFSLESPDGTLVPVAEDVRLLGIRAIAAEGAVEPAHA